MKYINTRNPKAPKIAVNAEFNEKTKTYLVDFEDGTNTTVTSSTFKRYYKPIADESAEPEAIVESNDEVAGDGTPIAEVGKEIAEQAKQKAKKAKAEKSAKKADSKKSEKKSAPAKKSDAKKSEKKSSDKPKRVPSEEAQKVKQSVISFLKKNKAMFKEVGKRVRLIDAEGKCYAYILSNKSGIRIYVKEDCKQYNAIKNVASDNKYIKSKYNKTALVEIGKMESVLSKMSIQK